jgi:hypothetical protein
MFVSYLGYVEEAKKAPKKLSDPNAKKQQAMLEVQSLPSDPLPTFETERGKQMRLLKRDQFLADKKRRHDIAYEEFEKWTEDFKIRFHVLKSQVNLWPRSQILTLLFRQQIRLNHFYWKILNTLIVILKGWRTVTFL